MNIEIKKLPKSKAELEIKIGPEEFNKFEEKAVLNLAKNLQVQGFRKGQVPKEIVRQKIDKSDLLKETTEFAIRETYIQAISKHNLQVLDNPEIEILKTPSKSGTDNSLEFKVKISLLPEIKLSDYKKIASGIKRKEVSVQEKEIEDSLKWLQKSRAKFSLKEGPAQKGDFVQIEYSISKDPSIKDAFILGQGNFIPGFEEKLEGMKSVEEKEFSLTHQKKKTDFKVKMISVQKIELPEISDNWAKGLGNFENLLSLKKSIKQGVLKEKEIKEGQRVCQEILEKIAKESDFEIPEILIERENEQMMDNFKKEIIHKTKFSFEDYLSKTKKTEEEIKGVFLPQAKQRVKNFLILKEIAVKEKIEVSDKEIKEKIEKILMQYPDIQSAKKQFDPKRLEEYTKETIMVEKTLEKLESFST